jgi:copper oxidase (laccase) domain-containing protein
VLFAGSGVVGAAHAGWRGALAGVLEATLDAMGPGPVTAVVGPCIGPNSYEVAADLRDAVLARDPADARFFVGGRPGHWLFDLPGYCAARLRAAGATVHVLGTDTLTDVGRFFSHRRRTLAGGGPIGHQISIVACSLPTP